MADEWDAFGNARDDDGFPPAPADVFGTSVEDVDVWVGDDSFDGAQEWFDFNDNEVIVEEEPEDHVPHEPIPEERTKVRAQSKASDRDRSRDRSTDRSRERSVDRSRDRSGSRDRSTDRSRDRSGSRDRSTDRSRDRERSSKGRSAGRSRSKSRDRSGDGHGEGHSDIKRGRRPKPLKNDPTKQPRKPSVSQSMRNFGEMSTTFDDSGDEDDGHKRSSRGSRSRHHHHHGSGQHHRRSGRSRTDDALASSYSSTRRPSASSSSRSKPLVRRRDGTVARPRPSEHSQRSTRSESRRDVIRESLFGAIGEDEPKNEISLGAFLKHDDKPPRKSHEERSVRSAPAAVHNNNSHRVRRAGQRKTAAPPPPSTKPQLTPQAILQEGGIKLDIAQLAEAGYIEVQDGKMRLVIDMET